MSNPVCKRTKRAIAACIGGQRVPVSGRQRGGVPDIARDRHAIECKYRQTVAVWLRGPVGS